MKAKFIRQSSIHVVIADDDPLRRVGLRALLEPEQDLELEFISLTETGTFPKPMSSCYGAASATSWPTRWKK